LAAVSAGSENLGLTGRITGCLFALCPKGLSGCAKKYFSGG